MRQQLELGQLGTEQLGDRLLLVDNFCIAVDNYTSVSSAGGVARLASRVNKGVGRR